MEFICRQYKKLVSLVLLVLLGCATTSPRLVTALLPAENIGAQIECQGTCKEEWERAQLWIVKHSRYKIQLVTDVLIETYNPRKGDTNYGLTVTKEPIGNSGYSIRLDLVCGNMFGGCSPTPVHVRNAFYYYVKHGKDLLIGVVNPFDSIR